MPGDMLDRFNPKVAVLVNALFTTEDLCLGGEKLLIKEQKTGSSYPPSSARNLDRFKVVVPFAGHTLKWEVIFSDPDMPPDFIFGIHDLDFVPDIEKIEPLVHWDCNDPGRFVSVIWNLLQHYKEYQTDMVKRIPRMQFDCDFLIGNHNYMDYEVHMSKGTYQMYESKVNILIKVPVDTECIPPYLIKDNPGVDMACLLVSYNSPEGNCHVIPKLFLSPRLERALGGSSSLHIPQWGGQHGSCLMDYLPAIHHLLAQKVDQISSGYNKRKEYISAFLSVFGGSILEYDAETYHKLSLLINVQGFYCIVHIDLSVGFPLDKPVFILQSIYHESNGIPYSMVQKDYLYSPRWSAEKMAESARTFLLEKIPEFKESSLSNGKF